MSGFKEVSSDFDTAKQTELPKEIGLKNQVRPEIPKEIGVKDQVRPEIPKEIDVKDQVRPEIPKEIGVKNKVISEIPREIGKKDVHNQTIVYDEYKIVDGKRIYTDDNGKNYRVDDKLLPNAIFEKNGYKYVTDSLGRLIIAEGILYLKSREARLQISDDMETIGKGDQRVTDDRGHVIADRFNGSNGMENIVPQDAVLNRGDYKKLENQLAERLKAGDNVKVKVEINYKGDSYRPNSFKISYSINGEKFVKILKN